MKTPLEAIKATGRYEAIMNILLEMAAHNTIDLPLVKPFVDGNRNTNWRIYTEDLRKDIQHFQRVIDIVPTESISLEYLSSYVCSEREMKLHNYAVTISHRNTPNKSEMEKIRDLSVLISAIDYLENPYDMDGEIIEIDIPKGWYKEDKLLH